MVKLQSAIATACQLGRTTVRPTSVALAAAMSISAAPAVAGDDASRQIGDWFLAASKDGEGCFLTRKYDRAGETTLLLGLDVDGTNRLTVLNTNWSIKPNDRLELTFRLSKVGFPEHLAIGIASSGKQGFVTSFGKEFPAYFASSRVLDIARGDTPVERLSLDGSSAAVVQLRKCVDTRRAQPSAKPGERKSSDSIPKDPFAAASGRERKR